MSYIVSIPSYDEDPSLYDDSRVNYHDILMEYRDEATQKSSRKPSLSDYDEA